MVVKGAPWNELGEGSSYTIHVLDVSSTSWEKDKEEVVESKEGGGRSLKQR